MKKIFFGLYVCCMVMMMSCSNAQTSSVPTNKADTAVLVTDTNNTLNATPVNDTTVNKNVPVH